jgi:long-subunit fatty acid transport protein
LDVKSRSTRRPAPRSLAAAAALLVFSLVAALVAPRRALASNGAAPIAISGRAAARGGADAAVADDALSLEFNPAGMLRTRGVRFDIQNMFIVSRDRLTNDFNDRYDADLAAIDPAAGVIVDPSGAPDGDWRIGFAVAVPFGAGGEKVVKSAVYPDGEKESLTFFDVRIGPALAWRPAPDVRLGAGIFYSALYFTTQSAATAGTGSAKGIVRRFRRGDGSPVNPPEPVLVNGQQLTYNELFSLASTPDSNSASLYKLSGAFAHAVSGTIGFQWDVSDRVTLGFCYTTPTYFTPIEGRAEIDASAAIDAIESDPDIAAITGSLFDAFLPDGQNASFTARYRYRIAGFSAPQSLSVGLALWPLEDLLIAVDFRWMNWSAAFRKIDVKLTGGDNPNINEINGSDEISTSVELGWRDIYIGAIGFSYAATDWLVLRAGYGFSTNPIPKNRASAGSPFMEHHVTGGVTAYPWDRVGITLGLVYTLPAEAENREYPSNPTYAYSRFKADQIFIYLGVSVDVD